MKYGKPNNAYQKLKQAEEDFSPVLVTASTGWGKTEFAKNYYKHRSVLVLTGNSGALNNMPDPSSIRQGTVIIDDAGWIFDPASREYIDSLLKDTSLHVVILTRGDLMPWLIPASLRVDFTYINEEDLLLDNWTIRDILLDGIPESDEDDINQICQLCRGFPLAVKLFKRHMEHGDTLDGSLVADVLEELRMYFDTTTFSRWPEDVRQFLLSTCQYDVFSIQMAEQLTNGINIHKAVNYCRHVGSFLKHKDVDTLICREELRAFLKWKQSASWNRDDILDNYRLAGDYYADLQEFSSALWCYHNARSTEDIQHILIENAKLHPGIGQYYDLQDYYRELPDEMIKKNPLLMLGTCFMYSIMLQPDESDRWHDELAAFEEDKSNPEDMRREAKAYSAYLDFTLPHKKRASLEEIIKDISILAHSRNIVMPEPSITGNQPSVMNGGLDVCQWSKNDQKIAHMLKIPFSILMRNSASGLINTGLAESGFEKNTMPADRIVRLLNDAYADASQNGTMQMCFATEGVLIKHYLTRGNIQSATETLNIFKERMYEEEALYLEKNVAALEVRLALFRGDGAAVQQWLRNAPNAKKEFCTMHRYIYMTKLRCQIATDQFDTALELSSFLDVYFQNYDRTYLKMENDILRSIILYRMGSAEWKELLASALKRTEEFHFVWITSIHGSAIMPLLNELDNKRAGISAEFMSEVLKEARKMALHYPNYLHYTPTKSIHLTQRESQILGLLCNGHSTEEICNICAISYSALKKHNRNIYSKLDVKNRADAERVAARLGIVHRHS